MVSTSTSSMATIPTSTSTTSRSAAMALPVSAIQNEPYNHNLDVIPPHPLQPCLKSIFEELKKIRNEVKQMQAEKKKMSSTFLNRLFK